MASLSDDAPANGVNGHDDILKTGTADVAEKTDAAASNASKNADSFNSNTTLLGKEDELASSEPEKTNEKPDVKTEDESAQNDEQTSEPAAKAENPSEPEEDSAKDVDAPTQDADTKPAPAEESAEKDGNDSHGATPEVNDEPGVSSKAETPLANGAPAAEDKDAPATEEGAPATEEDAPATEDKDEPATEDKDALATEDKDAPATDKDVPATDKDVPAAEDKDAPATDDKTEKDDIVMADAPAPAPAAQPKTAAPQKIKSPSAPAPTRSISSSLLPSLRDDNSRDNSFSGPMGHDTAMTDAPLAYKVSREREDDHEAGRSPKRAKTDETELTAAPGASTTGDASAAAQANAEPEVMPPRVRVVAKVGSLADPALDSEPISAYANREIRRVLASVKKTKAGLNFKDPVHKKWPMLWDAYTARVSKPVDISLLERNLREGAYANLGEFFSDIFLIYENSVSFNGTGNLVTDEAKSLVDNFFTRLSEVPGQEPQKPEKKEKQQAPSRQTEPRAATNRRESRGAATSPIGESRLGLVSPANAAAAGTAGAGASPAPGTSAVEPSTPFAVPPSGVPIIRRDSAKDGNDRPKRPINPPKSRDFGYEPKNPKKKSPEFRFCDEVLKELMKQKNYAANHWFMRPVDPVALQIPTYHKVIKKPMDLGTMQTKLNMGEYSTTKEFEADFMLIVRNCRKFNIAGDVVDSADMLEELFKAKWQEKDDWIAAHTPPAATHSPVGGKDDEYDDFDEDSEEDGDAALAANSSIIIEGLTKRLDEEQTRLNNLLAANVPDISSITTQQTVTNAIQKQLVEEKIKWAQLDAERRSKKAKSKSKKKASASSGQGGRKIGGAGGGSSKKSAGHAIAANKRSLPTKQRYMGPREKEIVTDGINNLEGVMMDKAIEIIKKDTHQEESEDGELELDIDQLSQDALAKIYDLVIRAFPALRIKEKKHASSGSVDEDKLTGAKPKKHKPMGKAEQERNIEKLREIKAQFQRPGSNSQEPMPSVEVGQGGDVEDESEAESDVDSEEE